MIEVKAKIFWVLIPKTGNGNLIHFVSVLNPLQIFARFKINQSINH